MSLSARIWARDVDLGAADPSSTRFVPSMLRHLLKEVADFDQGTGECYAYVSTLVRYTDMDRKTVLAYLAELQRRGLLRDTGRRAGKTKQTPIYQLVGFVPDFARANLTNAKSPAEGTLSQNTENSAPSHSQPIETATEFDDSEGREGGVGERVPPKGPFGGSAVPPTVPVPPGEPVPPGAAKGPAEERKESRRRDTNSYLNLPEHSDARAPARGRARAQDPEPGPVLDIGRLRGYWRSVVRGAIVGDGAMHIAGTERLWPPMSDLSRLRGTAAVAARALEDRLTNHFADRELAGEKRETMDTEMRSRVFEELRALRSPHTDTEASAA